MLEVASVSCVCVSCVCVSCRYNKYNNSTIKKYIHSARATSFIQTPELCREMGFNSNSINSIKHRMVIRGKLTRFAVGCLCIHVISMQTAAVALCATDCSDEDRNEMIRLFAVEALRGIKVTYTHALAKQLVDHVRETMPDSNADRILEKVTAQYHEGKKRKRDEPVSAPTRNIMQRVLRAVATLATAWSTPCE